MSGIFVGGLAGPGGQEGALWWVTQGAVRPTTGEEGVERKWMQGPRRPRGGQEPGRGVYVVRRIVAILVVLLVLVLLVPWAWQYLFGPGEEPSSEAPEVADVGDTGDEEAATDEGSADEEDIAASRESVVVERADRTSAEGGAGVSPAVVDLTAAVIPPPIPAAGGDETGGASGIGAAPDVAEAVPAPEIAAGSAAGDQQQAVQPIPSLEPSPFLEPVAFGGGISFGEEDFFGEVPFEGEALFEEVASEDQGSSGAVVATAGGTAAVG